MPALLGKLGVLDVYWRSISWGKFFTTLIYIGEVQGANTVAYVLYWWDIYIPALKLCQDVKYLNLNGNAGWFSSQNTSGITREFCRSFSNTTISLGLQMKAKEAFFGANCHSFLQLLSLFLIHVLKLYSHCEYQKQSR